MSPSVRFIEKSSHSLILLCLVAVSGLLAGCGDDDIGPPDGGPRVILVTTVAELDQALTTSSAGDTIEIRSEFTSTPYNLTKTYTIPANRSPLTIIGVSRSVFRPEIVFPTNVQGLVFVGHDGSSVSSIDIRGAQDAIVLDNSRVTIKDVHVRVNTRDGVSALGAGAAGSVVDSCLFESSGRFGVHMTGGAVIDVTSNTIVDAGDCGLYVGSNSTIRNNNIVAASVWGIFCDGNATAPIFDCNNVWDSGSGTDYNCSSVPDVLTNNFSLDPEFCVGAYTISEVSPLVAAADSACGSIGKFWVGCGPE